MWSPNADLTVPPGEMIQWTASGWRWSNALMGVFRPGAVARAGDFLIIPVPRQATGNGRAVPCVVWRSRSRVSANVPGHSARPGRGFQEAARPGPDHRGQRPRGHAARSARALLDADVNFTVVNDFIERVTEQIARPGRPAHPRSQRADHQDRLRRAGPAHGPGRSRRFHFAKDRPTVLMLCGLQGSGQNDHCRQAGPDPAGTRPQAAPGRRRLAAPRRRRSAQGARRTDRRPRLQRDALDAGRRLPERRRLCEKQSSRYHHPRHGRPAAHRRDADGRAEADRPRRPARRGLPGLRRHDRPGRRQQRQGVQRCPGPQRRHPDQARRRRPRRRRPVDQGNHQGADQVRRRRREAGSPWKNSGPRAWPSASSARATSCRSSTRWPAGPAGYLGGGTAEAGTRSWPRATSRSTTSASSSSR